MRSWPKGDRAARARGGGGGGGEGPTNERRARCVSGPRVVFRSSWRALVLVVDRPFSAEIADMRLSPAAGHTRCRRGVSGAFPRRGAATGWGRPRPSSGTPAGARLGSAAGHRSWRCAGSRCFRSVLCIFRRGRRCQEAARAVLPRQDRQAAHVGCGLLQAACARAVPHCRGASKTESRPAPVAHLLYPLIIALFCRGPRSIAVGVNGTSCVSS